jgi:8-oxo-dGTP pyrophosphatase MutT (NUDIX family)
MPVSQYIRSLRAKIGHDLLMLPSATAMLFDDRDRLLLAQNVEGGLWMTIGGAIDPSEEPADAAVRECWEETGLRVNPTRLLGVFGGPSFRITYPNGDVASYLAIVFEVEKIGGVLRADGLETSALRFVSREESKSLPMAPWNERMVATAFECKDRTYFAPPSWKPSQNDVKQQRAQFYGINSFSDRSS